MLRCGFFLIAFLGGVVTLNRSARADATPAWQALCDLDAARAVQLFDEEIKKHPADPAFLRGKLLAAFFSLDHTNEVASIMSLIDCGSEQSFLLPVYEHVAAEMSEWAEQRSLEEKIAQALVTSGNPTLAHSGRVNQLHLCEQAMRKPPAELEATLGLARGCWVTGPFDNNSNIAAFRAIPFEGEPLDTLATTLGVQGIAAGWTWLTASKYGHFMPYEAIENDSNIVCQARMFFELPQAKEILLLLGGAFSRRVWLDGVKIGADPTFRNAVVREGFRMHLDKGVHELCLALGFKGVGSGFRVSILDAAYSPIRGLRWLRDARVPRADSISTSPVHPLFDPYRGVLTVGPISPDSLFWKTILMIHNGYAKEAVEELEPLHESGKLSLMEAWALWKALQVSGDEQQALEILGYIKERTSTPLTDMIWILTTEQDGAARIDAMAALGRQYPDRYEIEQFECFRRLLAGDYAGVIAALRQLAEKYPLAADIHSTLGAIYARLNDYPSALQELSTYNRKRNDPIPRALIEGMYYERMGKYNDAIRAYQRVVEVIPSMLGSILTNLSSDMVRVGRAQDMAAVLDGLARRFPYDIEALSGQYSLYNLTGDYDQARHALERIHRLKPAAWRPYLYLDALHNNVPYDSIFGAVNVMALWDTTLSTEELGGNTQWALVDRIHDVLFESGIVFRDVHTVWVAADENAVESLQEMYLPVDLKNESTTLLTARRLRKGAAPLPGEVSGNSLVFKDLRPADAVELRYRHWIGREGDLWQHHWNEYQAKAGHYQRYWEYSILTTRQDLQYWEDPLVPPVEESEHCGFRKLTWHGEKAPPVRLDLKLLPPFSDILGTISISTVPSWETVNGWYLAISEAILDDNPRAEALAERLVDGLTSDWARFRSLYAYTVLDIPYQTIQFSYDATVPYKPDEVLANRWGDCKAKTHLLVKMLRHVGIPAWPVLVTMRDNGTRLPLPSVNFDHMIVCCTVGSDTLFADPTDTPLSPAHSLGPEVAGQPCLVVGWPQGDTLRRLPPYRSDDYLVRQVLNLTPMGNDRYAFAFEEVSGNYAAGTSRAAWKGTAMSEIAKRLESFYMKNWGVDLKVDSVAIDSVECLDSLFAERSYGTIALSTQTIGNTAILKLPDLSFINKNLPAELSVAGKRDALVDLQPVALRQKCTITLEVSPGLGNPRLPASVELRDSACTFSSRYAWSGRSRRLTIEYEIEIQPGYADFVSFSGFLRKSSEQFGLPIILEKP